MHGDELHTGVCGGSTTFDGRRVDGLQKGNKLRI